MAEPTTEDRIAVLATVFGQMAAQTLRAADRLGVADRLGDTERDAAAVAAEIGTDAVATARLLRALAALGYATEPRSGVFALTPRGSLLRTDRPDTMAALVRMFLDPTMVAAWGRLEESVRTGRTSFEAEFGTDFFAHLAAHPELSATFNASMRQGTLLVAATLPGTIDLSGISAITDVGGGDGTLLAGVLAAHPHLRGVLFDSVEGSAEAAPVLAGAGVTERVTVVSGDFFAAVPAGTDGYLLKSIVHDWDDDRVASILGHVRAVIPDRGRLVILEPVLPETVDGSIRPGLYLSDLNMLVNVGGRERTEQEFRALCDRCGFTVERVTPIGPTGFAAIEAVPA